MFESVEQPATCTFLRFTGLVAVNVTSLTMYRLTGTFNVFHGAALASLFFLIAGMALDGFEGVSCM